MPVRPCQTVNQYITTCKLILNIITGYVLFILTFGKILLKEGQIPFYEGPQTASVIFFWAMLSPFPDWKTVIIKLSLVKVWNVMRAVDNGGNIEIVEQFFCPKMWFTSARYKKFLFTWRLAGLRHRGPRPLAPCTPCWHCPALRGRQYPGLGQAPGISPFQPRQTRHPPPLLGSGLSSSIHGCDVLQELTPNQATLNVVRGNIFQHRLSFLTSAGTKVIFTPSLLATEQIQIK